MQTQLMQRPPCAAASSNSSNALQLLLLLQQLLPVGPCSLQQPVLQQPVQCLRSLLLQGTPCCCSAHAVKSCPQPVALLLRQQQQPLLLPLLPLLLLLLQLPPACEGGSKGCLLSPPLQQQALPGCSSALPPRGEKSPQPAPNNNTSCMQDPL